MNALVSNFVSKVQTKHWKNLQRRTQKLDPSEKDNLLEFLEDNLAVAAPTSSVVNDNNNNNNNVGVALLSAQGNINTDDDDDEFEEEDYELLQRDLEKANARLEELQSKHDFLQTRLETYRSKIKAAEGRLFVSNNINSSEDNDTDGDGKGTDNDDGDAKQPPLMSPERLEAMKEKIETAKRNLQPIEDTYRSIASELSSHQRKIESMQDRQMELKLKTQECMVVLQELSYNNNNNNIGETTNTTTLFSDDDDGIGAAIVDEEIEMKKDCAGVADTDNTIDCAVFEDEHASTDNDLENARINREDENDKEEVQNDETKIQIDETANDNQASLSIPVGTHIEID